MDLVCMPYVTGTYFLTFRIDKEGFLGFMAWELSYEE